MNKTSIGEPKFKQALQLLQKDDVVDTVQPLSRRVRAQDALFKNLSNKTLCSLRVARKVA